MVHHADGTREMTTVRPLEGRIVLDPDVQASFPDAEAVNTARRGLIALRPRPGPRWRQRGAVHAARAPGCPLHRRSAAGGQGAVAWHSPGDPRT